MAGQNHTLKQGHVNKLPLFIALGLAALSLIVVFILSHHKQQERSPIPTVPYDLEAQVQKAHDRSYDPASRQKSTQSPEAKHILLLKALFNRKFFLAFYGCI